MLPVLRATRFCSRIHAAESFTINRVHKVFSMPFSRVYPHYVNKVVRKGRTVDELHEVLRWLTGFSEKQLQHFITSEDNFTQFFAKAHIHENASMITGSICGVKIQEIEDPLMLNIRYMDKLVDELAKGRPMEKILRTSK